MEPLDPSSGTSLVHILDQRARRTPDRLAFRFLPDGTSDHAIDWTYRELAGRASAVAARLHDRVSTADVVLALDPGLHYVAALFGILPPAHRRALVSALRATGQGRFLAILDDCSPRAVLILPRFAGQADQLHEPLSGSAERPQWLFLDDEFYLTRPERELPLGRWSRPCCNTVRGQPETRRGSSLRTIIW